MNAVFKSKNNFFFRCYLILHIFAYSALCSSLQAEEFAILGGNTDTFINPYASIVSSDGTTTLLTGPNLPQGNGQISSVAINKLGSGIIGGVENQFADPYVSLVSSNGVTRSLTGPALPQGEGSINSVAINDSGSAVIGGRDNNDASPYAALVSSDGTTTALTGPALPQGDGQIFSVAINDVGSAIIGGADNNNLNPYASIVSSDGTTTALTGPALPQNTGLISSVAINDSGSAVIGGRVNGFVDPYAALVSSDGTTTALTGPALPQGDGQISSVAINSSGLAIIGGQDLGDTNPYVARVSSDGTTTALTGPALPQGQGSINSVAINSSGLAIIGGADNGNLTPYAALVSSDGITMALTGANLPQGNGKISSVAINDSGSAIIGGQDNGDVSPYAALVSPNGVVTSLLGPNLTQVGGDITSVMIADPSSIDPKSFGVGNVVTDTLFAFSTAVLQNHLKNTIDPFFIFKYQLQKSRKNLARQSPHEAEIMENLITDAKSQKTRWQLQRRRQKQKLKRQRHHQKEILKRKLWNQKKSFDLWIAPLGLFSKYQANAPFPIIRNAGTGAMIALDYLGWKKILFGGGFAYAYQGSALSQNLGHAHIHQELWTTYLAAFTAPVFLQASIWAGPYQMKNRRNILGDIAKARSTVHGWLLSPHIEASYPFYLKKNIQLAFEPFVMLDWANNWQRPVKEKGKADLNLNISAQYMSVLRSEIGVYYLQSIYFHDMSILELRVSLSFVNAVPFNVNESVPVSYLGSSSSFLIQIFDNRVENLGAVRGSISYRPEENAQFSLNYQGQLGAYLFSQVISLKMEIRF